MNPVNVTQKLINSAVPLTDKVKDSAAASISSATLEFVDRLSNSSTEMILDFIEKNARRVKVRSANDNLYRYNNLLLFKSNGQKAYNLEQNLKAVQDSGTAPKFVSYLEIGKDNFLTILEADADKIIPYTKVADKVKPEVKQKFINNVQKLLNDGVLNREVFANKDALFVTQNGKKIVYGDWSDIAFLNSNEKQKLLEVVKKWQI